MPRTDSEHVRLPRVRRVHVIRTRAAAGQGTGRDARYGWSLLLRLELAAGDRRCWACGEAPIGEADDRTARSLWRAGVELAQRLRADLGEGAGPAPSWEALEEVARSRAVPDAPGEVQRALRFALDTALADARSQLDGTEFGEAVARSLHLTAPASGVIGPDAFAMMAGSPRSEPSTGTSGTRVICPPGALDLCRRVLQVVADLIGGEFSGAHDGGPDVLAAAGDGDTGLGRVDVSRVVALADRETWEPPVPTSVRGPAGERPMPYGTPGMRGLPRSAYETHLVATACIEAGLRVVRTDAQLVHAGPSEGPLLVGFHGPRPDSTAGAASDITRDKQRSKDLLIARGVAVPEGRTFAAGEQRAAVTYGESIGYPLVVKPRDGMHGEGVTVQIASRADLDSAFDALAASRFGGPFIVERHVEGLDLRVMVVGDRVISVIHRMPANVVGDGVRSIDELAVEKNVVRRRLRRSELKLGSDADHWLARQSLTFDDVVEAGRTVRLRSGANASQGGDSIEVLDDVHPSFLQAMVAVVDAVPGVDTCAIDVLTADHRRPVAEQPFTVLELNLGFALALNHYPFFGRPRRPARAIVRRALVGAGVAPPSWRSDVTVELRVSGVVHGVGYRVWLRRQARRLRVDGWVENVPGGVRARLAGSTDAVGAIATHAWRGPPQARVAVVEARPCADEVPEGFLIR